MIVKVLTTDGTWWILDRDLTKEEESFENMWRISNSGDLIPTSEEETYIQKCNIVAVTLEKNEYDMSMLKERSNKDGSGSICAD